MATPRRSWLSDVDEGPTALGVTAVSVEDFWFGLLPAPPPRADTPDCGEWTHDQCVRGLEQFEDTERAVDASVRAPPLEPEVAEAAMRCLGWIRHAGALPGYGVRQQKAGKNDTCAWWNG